LKNGEHSLRRESVLLLASVLACLLTPAIAQPIVTAVRVDEPPRIDGRLDDDAWKGAAIIDGFIQREPHPGEPVSQKTEVLVCYNSSFLFFAFRCWDDPSGITAKEMGRDVDLSQDDRIQIILDTFLDGRNAYWFQVGPLGSIGDALVSENGAVFNKQWDGLWVGKARIRAKEWDAEVAIPFRTLSFRPGQTRWGLKLIRHIKRNLERAYWPTANLDTYDFQVSDSGILDGLEDITQGVGLDVAPYVLAGTDQQTEVGIKRVGDVGLDAFYQLTPGLKTSLTVNTDFAQTEVDVRQINLTRFPLFFPEKRDFFLEGANYFSFGPAGEGLIPFFSRRVGLDAFGNPIPIVWGAKLTGQYGDWNLGVLDIMDDRATRNPNFTVLRVRRNLGDQSSVGVIATSGNALSDADNSMVGGDFKLASSTFRGNKNVAFFLYGLKSETTGLAGEDRAFGAEFSYPNDFLSLGAGFRQIEKNFLAGVGFVPRVDVRESYAEATVGPRPERWGILQLFFGAGVDYVTDLDNRLLTRRIDVTPLRVLFLSGDGFSVKTGSDYEYLTGDFQIHPEHLIPLGGYEFYRHQVEFQSARRRNLWFATGYEWGSFYTGRRTDTSFAGGYKVALPLYVEFGIDRNRVLLADGDFTTNVSRVNVDVLFSPDVTLYSFLQYDNLSRTMGWQSRFRWILKPGNEILVVWNSNWREPFQRMQLAESTARVKLRYNFRF
jgi:hypothetical protein